MASAEAPRPAEAQRPAEAPRYKKEIAKRSKRVRASDSSSFIRADLLEEKLPADSVCGLCAGVLVDPASGCEAAHLFCRACLLKDLRRHRRCRTCNEAIPHPTKLVPDDNKRRALAGLRLHCRHKVTFGLADPPAAKRAQLEPPTNMLNDEIRVELNPKPSTLNPLPSTLNPQP